jgi:hypothetical protein
MWPMQGTNRGGRPLAAADVAYAVELAVRVLG